MSFSIVSLESLLPTLHRTFARPSNTVGARDAPASHDTRRRPRRTNAQNALQHNTKEVEVQPQPYKTIFTANPTPKTNSIGREPSFDATTKTAI